MHTVRQLKEYSLDELLIRRYDKYRKIGVFLEEAVSLDRNGRLQNEEYPQPPHKAWGA